MVRAIKDIQEHKDTSKRILILEYEAEDDLLIKDVLWHLKKDVRSCQSCTNCGYYDGFIVSCKMKSKDLEPIFNCEGYQKATPLAYQDGVIDASNAFAREMEKVAILWGKNGEISLGDILRTARYVKEGRV